MGFMQQFQPQPSPLSTQMSQLRSILQGDTSAMVSSLAQSNPQFAQFVAQNRGKTPQEAFKAYGYDFNQVLNLISS